MGWGIFNEMSLEILRKCHFLRYLENWDWTQSAVLTAVQIKRQRIRYQNNILIFSTTRRFILWVWGLILMLRTWTSGHVEYCCGGCSIKVHKLIFQIFHLIWLIDLIMLFNWNTIPIPVCPRQMSCRLHTLRTFDRFKWLQYSHCSLAFCWQEELLHRVQRHGPGGHGGGLQGHPRQGLRGRGARGEQCREREEGSIKLWVVWCLIHRNLY